jgi:hypothetical protein
MMTDVHVASNAESTNSNTSQEGPEETNDVKQLFLAVGSIILIFAFWWVVAG